MIASPVETGYGLLMILTSIPVYFVLIAWKTKPKGFQQGMGEYSLAFAFASNLSYSTHKLTGALNQKLQKLLMVVRPKSSQV